MPRPFRGTFDPREESRRSSGATCYPPRKSAEVNAKWCSCCCNGCIAAVVVRPAADSIVSGVWITDAAMVVVLVGAMTLPIGLGARMLSMVKSEVGDDIAEAEVPVAGREGTIGSRAPCRCRGIVSSVLIGLLANVRSCAASAAVSF